MKKLLGTAIMAMALAGCASPAPKYNPESWYAPEEVDIGKVAAVNQWAQSHGATVMWIHYPPKPKNEVAGN